MKQKILAIDDSLTLRQFISRCLSRHSADYQIVLAKDGTEGLALAATEKPDLILLDFVLPDMKGDDVCRELQANKKTAGYPVVLMSSSAADIKRTEAEFENVVKAIAKPFTPELLCATVAHSLREAAAKIPVAANAVTTAKVPVAVTPTRADVELAGDTSQVALITALLAIEQDRLTGALRLSTGGKPMELHVAAGRPLLVTSRDVAAYLKRCSHKFTLPQTQNAGKAGAEQGTSGVPLFLHFAEHQLMTPGEALTLTQQQGLKMFATLWTAPRAQFKFEPNAALPPLTAGIAPFEGTMSEWAMETLRFVGDDFRSAMAWGEPTGIPAYTRRGYERIQQIPLNDEELAFAGLINPTASLERIATAMRVNVDQAQRILHRFLCLEIFDYWPASLLRAA